METKLDSLFDTSTLPSYMQPTLSRQSYMRSRSPFSLKKQMSMNFTHLFQKQKPEAQ